MIITEIYRGLRGYGRAHRLIIRHRLWKYMLIPGIISMGVIFAIIAFGAVYFDDAADHIVQNWLPAFFRHEAVEWLTLIFLWILLSIGAFMAYKHITLALISPVLGQLSEKTEQLIRPAAVASEQPGQFFADLARGILINLRNLAYTLALTAIAWPLVFIPVVGAVLSTIIILLIQAYYGGFGLMDCVLERRRYSVRRSVAFAKANRGRMLGVGGGFMLLLAIPLVGWFIAPAYGAVAATLAALEKIETHSSTK